MNSLQVYGVGSQLGCFPEPLFSMSVCEKGPLRWFPQSWEVGEFSAFWIPHRKPAPEEGQMLWANPHLRIRGWLPCRALSSTITSSPALTALVSLNLERVLPITRSARPSATTPSFAFIPITEDQRMNGWGHLRGECGAHLDAISSSLRSGLCKSWLLWLSSKEFTQLRCFVFAFFPDFTSTSFRRVSLIHATPSQTEAEFPTLLLKIQTEIVFASSSISSKSRHIC